jgi:hypothetical protein
LGHFVQFKTKYKRIRSGFCNTYKEDFVVEPNQQNEQVIDYKTSETIYKYDAVFVKEDGITYFNLLY